MQNLLELKGASRRVSDRFSLRDVSLSVEPGQIVGFVGANGAGKTTTIRAALGLIKLDAGEVRLLGQKCSAGASNELQRNARSRIGLVLDACPFPSTLKVAEIERAVGSAYPTWSHETFRGLIDRFSLEPKAKVKALSRGMGMKLQLACALSHKAELLILDEATAGLDPMAREELLDELLSFVADGQHGVLFSSHITSDLERAADRVVCIDNGAIVFDLLREDITDLAGIAHCTQAQAAELLACVDGARAARHTYSVDVLVPTDTKRSRPSPRFHATAQPLMTICALR